MGVHPNLALVTDGVAHADHDQGQHPYVLRDLETKSVDPVKGDRNVDHTIYSYQHKSNMLIYMTRLIYYYVTAN